MKWLWFSGVAAALGIGGPFAYRLQQPAAEVETTRVVVDAAAPATVTSRSNTIAISATQESPARAVQDRVTTVQSAAPVARAGRTATVETQSVQIQAGPSGATWSAPARVAPRHALSLQLTPQTRPFDPNIVTTPDGGQVLMGAAVVSRPDLLSPPPGSQSNTMPGPHQFYVEQNVQSVRASGYDADEARFDATANTLVMQIAMAEEADREALRTRLTEVTEQHFDHRQNQRRAEIADLEQRLAEIKKRVESRDQKRSQIVVQRVDQLLGEDDLQWDEARGGRQFYGAAPGSFAPSTRDPSATFYAPNPYRPAYAPPVPGFPSPLVPPVDPPADSPPAPASEGAVVIGVPPHNVDPPADSPPAPAPVPSVPALPAEVWGPSDAPSLPSVEDVRSTDWQAMVQRILAGESLPSVEDVRSTEPINTSERETLTRTEVRTDDVVVFDAHSDLGSLFQGEFDGPEAWAKAELAYLGLKRQFDEATDDARRDEVRQVARIVRTALERRHRIMLESQQAMETSLIELEEDVNRMQKLFERGLVSAPEMRRMEAQVSRQLKLEQAQKTRLSEFQQTLDLYAGIDEWGNADPRSPESFDANPPTVPSAESGEGSDDDSTEESEDES